MYAISDLLKKMVEIQSSDLHLTPGVPPLFRLHGDMVTVVKEVLSPDDCIKLSYSVMNEVQQREFERNKELDFSFGMSSLGRFRANCYQQRGTVSIAIRHIPYEIRSLEELGLPKILGELCDRPSGLILVTGATGSGKSTTLAAMIDRVNTTKQGHILTIEDPIEFVHKHKKCMVSQREIHSDTQSFASALRVALRQDPDYVLVGEMRDTETMSAALSIAETGHLTFATLHTNSAAQTVNRIIDSFPAGEQAQIRTQISFVLQGIVSQILVPRIGGGRVVAAEILIATPAIRSMIRDDKLHQVQGMIETGQKWGMQTMSSCLADLVASGKLDRAEAMSRSPDPEGLQRAIQARSTGRI